MNYIELKKIGEIGALDFFLRNDNRPSQKLSDRLEPQNFRRDGSLGFGETGVPPWHPPHVEITMVWLVRAFTIRILFVQFRRLD